MPPLLHTVLLLLGANVFMTFAWYGHLKHAASQSILVAIFASWGIAFFEYCLQVPANRIGHVGGIDTAKLKIIQEVITLAVFVPFSIYYLQKPIKLDYFYAALCMCGAVYFIFRS
jgi:uncharacterized protein